MSPGTVAIFESPCSLWLLDTAQPWHGSGCPAAPHRTAPCWSWPATFSHTGSTTLSRTCRQAERRSHRGAMTIARERGGGAAPWTRSRRRSSWHPRRAGIGKPASIERERERERERTPRLELPGKGHSALIQLWPGCGDRGSN